MKRAKRRCLARGFQQMLRWSSLVPALSTKAMAIGLTTMMRYFGSVIALESLDHSEQEWRRRCSGSQEPLLEDTLLDHSCELHNVPQHIILTSVRARFGRYPCASERAKE